MRIDLNSDMGESFGRWTLGDDRAMLAVVSSANIACGFHAGDPHGIAATLRGAAEHDVAVGAHVSYRDLAGFGRRFLDVSPTDLTDDVIYQIGALQGLAHSAGTTVSYVKPHGALYNRIAHDAVQARAVVDAITQLDPALALLTLPGSVVGRIATDAGLRVVSEVFADRGYRPDGFLVPRTEPGAVLTLGPRETAARIIGLLRTGELEAVDGSRVRIPDAASVCVHSDSPGAVEMATALREALLDAGVEVTRFA